MMIPSEDGPKASVRVSKETVPRRVSILLSFRNPYLLMFCFGGTHHQPVPEDLL